MTRPQDLSTLFTIRALCVRNGHLNPDGSLSTKGFDQAAAMARSWHRHADWTPFSRAYTSPTVSCILSAGRFLGELNAVGGSAMLDANLPGLDLTFLDPARRAKLESLRGSVGEMCVHACVAELQGRMEATLLGAAKACTDDVVRDRIAADAPVPRTHMTASDMASVFGRGKGMILMVGESPLLELAAINPMGVQRLHHGDAILYTITMSAVETAGLWYRRFTIAGSERLQCPVA